MKYKIKKFTAVIMLILMIITSLPISAFATFITDIDSDAQFGVVSGSLSAYGHELHYAKYDGTTYLLFCAEYGQTSPTGKEYTYNSDFVAEYKANRPKYEKVAEMIYFGYAMEYGLGLPTSTEAKKAACATQQYVWEYIHDNIDSSKSHPTRNSWDSSYMSSSIYSSWLSATEKAYKEYHSDVSFNTSKNNVVIGDTTTLKDKNGALKLYADFNKTIDGVTFSHTNGSNDLKISVAEDSKATNVKFNSKDYGLYAQMPNGDKYNSSKMSNYVYFKFNSGAIQNLMFSNYVDPASFSVSVEVESGNVLIIKTNTAGNALDGCKFGLYKDENCTQLVGTGTSNANGEIKFERLATKTYWVKELSVKEGYLLDTSVKKVNVTSGKTAEVTFKNNEPTGEITITKTDKKTGNQNRADKTSHHGDATLKGTIITLYANEDITNVAKTIKYFSKDDEIATFTFDEYGKATTKITNTNTSAKLSVDGNTIKGLPMGTYKSLETKASKGYKQNNEVKIYTLKYKDMNTPVIKTSGTIENEVERAKFEVIKISSITPTTAPVIEGAEFTAILDKYVKYYGSFEEAQKHLSEFADDEYSVFKTGSNGHGVSGLLAYGEYRCRETYTPSDRINTVEDFYINIDKNSDGVIKEFVENDTPFTSYLKMIKEDKNTGKKVTLTNATFKLEKLNDETNKWEKVTCKVGRETFDSWTTDNEGIAYTETKLNSGKYKLSELKIPDGFLQLEKEIEFEISKSNKTLEFDKEYDAYITVTAKNEQPKATIIIDKEVAIRQNVDTSLVDISDLSGIKFKLTAKEQIVDKADGSTIYEKGQEVGTYNLTKTGDLKIDNLPLGIYECEEIETLKGLVLDTTKHEVKIEQKDLTTKVYTEKLNIKNDTTAIEVSKTDITGDKELVGATLTILDGDKVIDTWVSTENKHLIEGLETNKEFILREEIACEGYVKATDVKFVVENSGDVQKVTMVDKVVDMSKVDLAGEEIVGAKIQVLDKENNTIVDEWVSEKIPHRINNLIEGKKYILHEELAVGTFVKASDIEFEVSFEKQNQHLEMVDKIVEISKQDITTGEELEGAKLQVIDKETNAIIDEWISEKTPQQVVGLEELKDYQLLEVTSPYGYEIAEMIEFQVTGEKTLQKVVMKDKPILTDIRVVKIDSDTKEVIKDKFTFALYSDKECTQLVQQMDSDKEQGIVTFEGIRYGKWYISELSAPKGYEKSDKVIELEINDKGVFIDGKELKETDEIYSFEYENKKIETPKTSDDRNIILPIIVMAISITGLAVLTIRKLRKKENN